MRRNSLEVMAQSAPGTSGIIAMFDITWKPKVDEALKNASKIDEEEVSPESAAKLKDEAAMA